MDFWKGAVFVRLQEGGILEDFAVDPMLTDAKDWHTADFHLYAGLLQIRPNQILRHKSTLSEYRKSILTRYGMPVTYMLIQIRGSLQSMPDLLKITLELGKFTNC